MILLQLNSPLFAFIQPVAGDRDPLPQSTTSVDLSRRTGSMPATSFQSEYPATPAPGMSILYLLASSSLKESFRSVYSKDAPAPAKLSRNAKKRKSWAKSHPEEVALKKQVLSQLHLHTSIAGASSEVTGRTSYQVLPKTASGASGSKGSDLKREIDILVSNAEYRTSLLRGFRIIPYR